ncbi:PQQ-binding-like beta-propeller repeat protein [Labilibaculum sp. K2S]|uniref:outer membrane protein assembly factor BamB family protein n=1 Tax=Labilibaculum sp. K2S TaxID=3056386 RepID=UPI0025A3F26A|nr:PQQ-binding-like beta-propeller repeat protein [Labilibaculum sp. K2S]MDM8160851.1 PQQ-binding-like beta-propeller repeat protein [Labilibaculum sp. K2S]
MANKFKINRTNLSLWKGIAMVAGTFSFVICMLVLVNYIQINRIDPVNTEVINSLVNRLNENPNDVQLREQIREMDLLVRKAYFTNQWQVKAGGYLFLFGIIVTAIALQLFYAGKQQLPQVSEEEEENIILFREKARKWIVIGGFGMVGITLLFAFLTHKELGNQFTEAATIAKAKHAETKQTNITIVAKEEITEPVVEEKVVEEALKEEIVVPVAEEEKVVVEEAKTSSYKGTYPSKEMMANFPSFRGPGGNAIAYQKNIPIEWDGASGKNILWKQPVPIHAYNSPVIWGNKLFLSGASAASREVYCYDRNNGKLLWTAKAEQIAGSPANPPEVTPDTGHSASTVTTDGNLVFAIFSNGDLIAVDMSGKKQWAKNLGVPDNHYGHSSSLIVFEDKLIVQYDQKKNSKVMALSTSSGEEVWSTARKVKVSWASPVIVQNGDQVEILLAADPCIASYDAQTGKELWKIDCITGEVGPSVAYANGIVFALNEYASLVAIKPGAKPEILWEAYDYLSDVPSPIAYNDLLFVVTSYGAVACYNAKAGEILWEKEFDGGFYASPILADGKIYLMDRKGVMHIFKADKEYVELAPSSLGEKSDASPAFADGRVYIRGDKNLYCIGK